jgi:hypothetical protein
MLWQTAGRPASQPVRAPGLIRDIGRQLVSLNNQTYRVSKTRASLVRSKPGNGEHDQPNAVSVRRGGIGRAVSADASLSVACPEEGRVR